MPRKSKKYDYLMEMMRKMAAENQRRWDEERKNEVDKAPLSPRPSTSGKEISSSSRPLPGRSLIERDGRKQLQNEWGSRLRARKKPTKEAQNEFPDLPHRPETHLRDSPSLSGKTVKETRPLVSNKHALSILEALHQDSTFADVTLIAQGKTLKAHKAVLSAGSVYFKNVFTANPCQHPIVIMPFDMSYQDLKGIIDYIYKGELTLPSSELTSLLKAAAALKISGLTKSSDFEEGVLKPNVIRMQSERSNVSLSPFNTQLGTNRLLSEGETSLSPVPCFVYDEGRDKAQATELLSSCVKRKLSEYTYPEEASPDAQCKIPRDIGSNTTEEYCIKSEEFGEEFEELDESASQCPGTSHLQRHESPTRIGETECIYVVLDEDGEKAQAAEFLDSGKSKLPEYKYPYEASPDA